MSDDSNLSGGLDAVVQPYVNFWSDYIRQTNDVTRELLEGINGNSDAKSWQRRWFSVVSESMDAFLRSPVFLQAMKQNTDMAIKAKQQADDLGAEFARNANIPTANDISGLFERLHSVEEGIVVRLGRIEQRLDELTKQVNAGQPAGA